MTRIIPLTLAVALFMENMDATVIATSLPAIAEDIGTTPVALKLAFTAYFVSLAIFIPISSWVADKYGAKNVFRAAIVVFIIGSICCAFAGSLQEFVGARFLKGMGGAMMSPLARLILLRTTEKSKLVDSMAWLTIPALVAPTMGPPVGGFLTTFLSWHWIFLINVPIGLAGLVLITRFLPEVPVVRRRPMDFPGFVMIGISFAGIVFGLSLVSLPVLPMWVAAVSTAVGVVAAIAYLSYARRAPHPLLDPKIFEDSTFRAAISGTTLFLIGAGAVPFLLPLMLQLAFGYTPFESGMITFTGALGALIMKFFAGRLYMAIGFRTALIWAAVLSTIGMVIKGSFNASTPVVVMMVVILMVGIFRSVFFTGQNALAFADVKEEDQGPATAIHAVMRPIATALGVALAGGVLEASSSLRGAELELIDFQIAFYVVAAVSALSAVPFLLMSRQAGASVSGHRSKSERAAALAKSTQSGLAAKAPRF
ncbi:MFS transporter [Devosia pacifica]|uniref:MFS transporter n=1 Tax=Devosia pacifica TaxID=1335967 RepID=A0A918SDQ9_9HYPH|nr:MFS transporter [Devosia pacifica]GHA35118.1 MFS transporter [Devosia pacifica]